MASQFSDLGINKVLQESLAVLDISVPTDIQVQTIPIILNQTQDLVVLAKTGSGKTAAFGLPLLQLIDTKKPIIQAVILVPTRELGHQIFSDLESYATRSLNTTIVSICGGVPIKPQIERLKSEAHIIVATPGRLSDLIKRNAIHINDIAYFILDEADEMLSAHKEELNNIIKNIPKNRRTLLFTATLPGTIKQMVQNYMSKQTLYIETNKNAAGHQGIDHRFIVVEPIEKLDVLLHFLNTNKGQRGIIFCKTKAAVNKLAKKLAINKFSSGAIHGSLSQGIRNRIMEQFRNSHIAILVATDLAARGIDVKALSWVVNYHLPDTYQAYVHRSGRTARAGANGLALTIIQQEEEIEIKDFEAELNITFKPFNKPDIKSIQDNNTLLWANKIFKTKPNRDISETLKAQVKTLFHHLTKEELIDKLLANYLTQTKALNTTKNTPKNKT